MSDAPEPYVYIIPFDLEPAECRRPGWADGPALALADGREWPLPRLNAAFVATVPGLAEAIADVCRFSSSLDVLLGLAGNDPQFIGSWRARLRRVARLALVAAYDLRSPFDRCPLPEFAHLAALRAAPEHQAAVAGQMLYEGLDNPVANEHYGEACCVVAHAIARAGKANFTAFMAGSTLGASGAFSLN